MHRLRSNLSLIPMAEGVQLRAGDEDVFVLRGDTDRLTRVLEAMIVGTSRSELLSVVGSESDNWLQAILDALSAESLLESPVASQHSLDEHDHLLFRQVELLGDGPFATVIAELLGRSQSDASPKEPIQPTVLLVAWDRPHLSFVAEANSTAISRRLPCLFVDLSHGRHATLGPFFVPGEGACFECYRQWWRRNSQSLGELDAAHRHMLESQQPLRPFGNSSTERHWIASMALVELAAFLRRSRPLRTLNRQITIDLDHLTTHSEPVWRIPWCSACGLSRSPEFNEDKHLG